jgi:hypothetical protein
MQLVGQTQAQRPTWLTQNALCPFSHQMPPTPSNAQGHLQAQKDVDTYQQSAMTPTGLKAVRGMVV